MKLPQLRTCSLHISLTFALAVALLAAVSNRAMALGGDHPKGQKVGSSAWSEELTALANRDSRVHGYFVNWHDTLFYAGATKELNTFLADFAKLGNATSTVYLQTGRGIASSPWKSDFKPAPYDWQLDITAGTPSLRIWIGGDVKLSEIQTPKNIAFAQWPAVLNETPEDAASKAQQEQIRDFIAKHEAASKPKTTQKVEPAAEQPGPSIPILPSQKTEVAAPGAATVKIDVPAKASADGRYTTLLRTVAAPGDAATYGEFNDAGYSKTPQWAGQANLPAGYWVYVAPNWYIWESQALTPKITLTPTYTTAAADMQGRMVTVYLDNGTPIAGRLVERTDEYYVLLLDSGAKKLIFKAKITSIEWTSETKPATRW